jgi:hypothetical protein
LPKRHFWFIVRPRGNDDDREKKCREDGARYSQANPQKSRMAFGFFSTWIKGRASLIDTVNADTAIDTDG